MSETVKRVESKNWCFTSFNMGIDWEHLDVTVIDKKGSIKYLVYQGEYTKDDRKHIQGFVQFDVKKDMSFVKKLFKDNTLHLEVMAKNSTPQQAADYCKKQVKDGEVQKTFFNYIEYGELDNTVSGTRTDLIDLRDRIAAGETVNKIMMTTTDNKTMHNCIQYNRTLKEFQNHVHQVIQRQTLLQQYDNVIWNNKQQIIKDIIDEELQCTNNRRINWIYDDVGNVGKTHLAKYYIAQGDCYYVTGGKQADILYAYEGQSIIIYDLARTYSDNLDHIYTTIENFKNGCYLSTKYNTDQRVYAKQPIIVVLANFKPDQSKLSKDRWNVVDINKLVSDQSVDKSIAKAGELDVDTIMVCNKLPKLKRESAEEYYVRASEYIDQNAVDMTNASSYKLFLEKVKKL